MPAPKRRFEPAVIERLFAQPYRFQYFQAVRLIELWLRRRGMPEEGLLTNFLRFSNSTSLAFPASEIESLLPEPRAVEPKSAALAAALHSSELRYVRHYAFHAKIDENVAPVVDSQFRVRIGLTSSAGVSFDSLRTRLSAG